MTSLNRFTPAMKQGYVTQPSPYSSTLFQSGVHSAGAMHGLSNGQACIITLLSVAAGIPLAAAMKFSRSKSIAIVLRQ